MGIIDDLIGTVSKEGGATDATSDPKKTESTVNDDGDAKVRNTSVVINHDVTPDDDNKGHDMLFSKTTVDGKTGETKYEEGAHGPKFKP